MQSLKLYISIKIHLVVLKEIGKAFLCHQASFHHFMFSHFLLISCKTYSDFCWIILYIPLHHVSLFCKNVDLLQTIKRANCLVKLQKLGTQSRQLRNGFLILDKRPCFKEIYFGILSLLEYTMVGFKSLIKYIAFINSLLVSQDNSVLHDQR